MKTTKRFIIGTLRDPDKAIDEELCSYILLKIISNEESISENEVVDIKLYGVYVKLHPEDDWEKYHTQKQLDETSIKIIMTYYDLTEISDEELFEIML